MQYTMDTNCIIDLEEDRVDAVHLKKMLDAHRKKQIELSVVAISASENQKGGKPSKTFDEFSKKLKAAGLKGVNILIPMMYWDVTYWEHAMWDGDRILEQKIHDILFPGAPIEKPQEVGFPIKKWLNIKCDVQVAWAHLYHKQDVLVTRDRNFHKHSKELSIIGISKIITPDQFQP